MWLRSVVGESVSVRDHVYERSVGSDFSARLRCREARWRGPAVLIRRTLSLLIDNAVKFTSAGSVILGCESSTKGLVFSVTDTGRGMTPHELEWIRIPFAQVDGGMSRTSSGMGLGLPLATRFAKAMGGALLVTAAPGCGATVTFTARAVTV